MWLTQSVPPLQLSQQLDGLLGMLCADVAPADGASIQQNLKLLEEKLQTVGSFSLIDSSRSQSAAVVAPLFRVRHCPHLLSLQSPACLRCVRRGRWCWSRCAASSRGPWRRPRVQSGSSRTTCSTSRPSWMRCSSGSRGDGSSGYSRFTQ